MATSEMVAEQVAILRRIDELPKGSISYKTIKGKVQPYLQWSEGGKTRSRYLKASERDGIIAQVAERKRLEEMLAAFKEDEVSYGGDGFFPKDVQYQLSYGHRS